MSPGEVIVKRTVREWEGCCGRIMVSGARVSIVFGGTLTLDEALRVADVLTEMVRLEVRHDPF